MAALLLLGPCGPIWLCGISEGVAPAVLPIIYSSCEEVVVYNNSYVDAYHVYRAVISCYHNIVSVNSVYSDGCSVSSDYSVYSDGSVSSVSSDYSVLQCFQ